MENQTPKSSGLSPNFWIIIGILLIVAIIIVVVTFAMKGDTDPRLGPSRPGDDPSMVDNGDAYDLDDFEAEETVYLDEDSAIFPGISPVIDDQVVDQEGQPVRTDVEPMSPSAPQQSDPIEADDLPDEVIKITASAEGWEPSQFTVTALELVSLSVTSIDQWTHIFKFDDPSLSAVAIGVAPGETRAIKFNAPSETGEYSFYCDVPGHTRRGEVGIMIVE